MWASMITWLNAVAAVVGPVSIIIGLPSAVVGSIFAVVRVRRWVLNTLVPAQEATQAAAEQAKTAATAAEGAAQSASKHEKSAGESALALKETNGHLVALLPEKDNALEYLKETNSRLVAQLVIQASKHPEDFDSRSAPRFVVPRDDAEADQDDIWTTGRHSLRPAADLPRTAFLEGGPE